VGLLDMLFKKRIDDSAKDYFKALTAYTPVFTTFEGSVYEMELTRAAIHSFANACSKLKPEVVGVAARGLERVLQFKPNPLMDTSRFIYRIATILSVCNNAFIVPIEDEYGEIGGYFPVLPQNCEVLEAGGVMYLRYTFATGVRGVIEYSKVGVLTQHFYKDDVFGEDNRALKPTMQLIHTNNQGIINGVKNSATIRFLARAALTLKPDDVRNARDQFSDDMLSDKNQSGLILVNGNFGDFKQVENKPFTVNPAQMKQINENVFNYFGVNENILQNKYNEDEWNAFYEGKIEPFAIQLSLAMSNMTFTPRELSFGNSIVFTSNRLQYASNKTKLEISSQLFDRGILSRNDIMDIWNMARVEDGDKRYIRRDYVGVENLDKEFAPSDTQGADNQNGGAYNADN
jgi:hypothetical protein